MQMVELREVKEFDELQPIMWGICQFATIEGRKSYKDDGWFFGFRKCSNLKVLTASFF